MEEYGNCIYCNGSLREATLKDRHKHRKKLYCNNKCRLLHKTRPLICHGCGKEFRKAISRLKRSIPKYCGQECYRKYYATGKYITKKGYVFITDAVTKRGNLLEHRVIMEKHLGRKLGIDEHVHHKNGIKFDNRIENLEVVMNKMHFGTVCCPSCKHTFKVR